jgi:oligopeptide/dipeptide ABC transporter ATP-binding protein
MPEAAHGEPAVVEVRGLVIEFNSRGGKVRALDGVDFSAWPGECIGLIGESGSGKSTLAMALGGVNRGRIATRQGSVRSFGRDVFALQGAEQNRFLSQQVGFVFQDPIGSLDPTRRIGRQFFAPDGQPLPRRRLEELLAAVGLPETDRILASYPHEVSGGMAQRICIALAIAPGPQLLVADEPTAALDAAVRRQVLDLLTALNRTSGATLILVSHDLPSVRRTTDRVCVMYAGRIIESGPTREVLESPRHPYTAALLQSIPGAEGRAGRIVSIPGHPPAVHGRMECCAFTPRCRFALPVCAAARPESVTNGARAACCFLPPRRLDATKAAGDAHAAV